jgi:hypothetical protein
MPQLSLSSFLAPEPIKVFDCTNCVLQKGFFQVASKEMVKCMGQLKDIPLKGCSCYSNGREIEELDRFAPPHGWQAKKYVGRD